MSNPHEIYYKESSEGENASKEGSVRKDRGDTVGNRHRRLEAAPLRNVDIYTIQWVYRAFLVFSS